MSNRPSAPLAVTLNVTGACNLACRYCYFQPRLTNHMPIESFRKALEILASHKVFLLTISGGESFLHPEIDRMITLAHESFERVSVLTNGTRITDASLATIESIVAAKGAFPIQVSLDSIDPEVNDELRGSTRQILRNLERLSDAGATVTVAIVISSRNLDSVTRTIVSLRGITRYFHLMPLKTVPFLAGRDADLVVDTERMRQIWQELQRVRERYRVHLRTPLDSECRLVETSATGAPCMAGFTKLAIDPNLDVRPCDKLVEEVVGNLGEETLEEIWQGPRLEHIYRRRVPYCMRGLEGAAA